MSKVKILVAVAIAGISLPAQPGWSEPQPMQYGYRVVSPQVNGDDLPCYMTTTNARTLDLGRLCGSVPTSSTSNYQGGFSNYRNTGNSGIRGSSSNSGSSSSGICNTPNDIARDGSRCGGRAASERPGGNSSNGRSSTLPSLEPSRLELTPLTPTRNISIDNPSSSGSSSRTCSVNSFSNNGGGSAVSYSYGC